MGLIEKETIIHRSETDYCKLIKHLELTGNNMEIGYRLGEIARKNHRIERPYIDNKLKNQCQKEYLKVNYPVHYERMRGFAEAYGESLSETHYDFTCFGHPLKAVGCSAVYYPPSITESHSGVLSRNLDFPVASLDEIVTGKKDLHQPPVLSTPYILEIHPDEGYSTIGMFSYDLFGLLLDGMNSEGLIVTHLHADSIDEKSYIPSLEYGVGINEMLVVQMILDNCRSVEEAKVWLWKNKHFYMFVPTHLLIADKYGDSFVWEYSIEHNKEFVTEKKNEVNILTNFPVHKYLNISTFPESIDKACPFSRYKSLFEHSNCIKKSISENEIIENNARVFITNDMFNGKEVLPTTRTIYHNIYNSKQKSMKISFFCGETGNKHKRTEYYEFQL